MNALPSCLTASFILAAPVAALAQIAPNPAPPSGVATANAEVAIELSPFVVSEDAEPGWLATSTLAGSRLNTPLRDTGASIAVLTSEFLKDIAAIELEDAVDF
jgi:hypothetical protein